MKLPQHVLDRLDYYEVDPLFHRRHPHYDCVSRFTLHWKPKKTKRSYFFGFIVREVYWTDPPRVILFDTRPVTENGKKMVKESSDSLELRQQLATWANTQEDHEYQDVLNYLSSTN